MKKGENIYRRQDGRWEGRFRKGKKVDGSIYFGYVYAYSYKEVKHKLIQKKMEYMGKSNDQFSGTFMDWSEYWMNNIMIDKVKESTIASYRSKLKLYILPDLGNKELVAINKTDIEILVRKLGNHYSPKTVKVIFQLANNIFNAAVKNNKIHINPCFDVELPRTYSKEIAVLTLSDQKRIEGECINEPSLLPILLALHTGLRLGEICGLKWNDIDFSKKEITIRRTVQRIVSNNDPQSTKIIITSPKTEKSNRSIPMSFKIETYFKKLMPISPSKFIFTKDSRPLEPRTLSYRFSKLLKKLNINSCTFHCLRHTFATRAVELGIDVATISSLLGHSSVKMTLDTYVHSLPEKKIQAIDLISTL